MEIVSWKNVPSFTEIVLLIRQNTNSIWSIINAFDHMELCLVINLTKGDKKAIPHHQYLLLGMLALLLPFIPGSKYLLPAKKS